MPNDWDMNALTARIADSGARLRYEAGSPNSAETERYGVLLKTALRHSPNRAHVVVLGMTPELRQLVQTLHCRVSCVDNNAASIELYRDWIAAGTEHIVETDWMALASRLDSPADAILGDGVFGNIASLETARELLNVLHKSLTKTGSLILRTVVIPHHFPLHEQRAECLLERFRAGRIDAAEFGFGMRKFGNFDQAYNAQTQRLDNRISFECYRRWLDEGVLSQAEYAAIQRYYFGGYNLMPTQHCWEALLDAAGFDYERQVLQGKEWYEYYPIYHCLKVKA